MMLRKRLEAAIAAQGAPSSDYDLNRHVALPKRTLRAAAVLIPIVQTPDPQVILTKRSSALKHHAGQIAFPGGKVDEGDDGVIGAALREANEEIALSSVDVLGTLPPHETVTGFTATPVVGLVDPNPRLIPAPGEVEEVFMAPLAHFLEPGNYAIESRRWRGERRYYYSVPWGPYYVWGATARMLRALADRMAHAAN